MSRIQKETDGHHFSLSHIWELHRAPFAVKVFRESRCCQIGPWRKHLVSFPCSIYAHKHCNWKKKEEARDLGVRSVHYKMWIKEGRREKRLWGSERRKEKETNTFQSSRPVGSRKRKYPLRMLEAPVAPPRITYFACISSSINSPPCLLLSEDA